MLANDTSASTGIVGKMLQQLGEYDKGGMMTIVCSAFFRLCEGFRTPAPQEPIHAHGGRRSENLQRTKPRV